MTPFEDLYGVQPPLYIPYVLSDSNVEAVDFQLRGCESAIALLKHHPQRAMSHMHQQVDKHIMDSHASVIASSELPPMARQSAVLPQAILDHQMVKWKNAAAAQFLVHCQGSCPADATWEFADDFQQRFPYFSLGTRNLS
ncbi:hypothetical protein GH714_029720 [Hevea brasiliensis]|uniref:Chromo domain-containing protein n=1 Tax=Hevea brasiliensis TaxID=3981 RepID=A0A6A6M409_HEVBR|nr:hypothetical protein GH714_029720 [Hevea brasiliensis]